MYEKVDSHGIHLSEMQGNVFEMSCDMGLDSRRFIEVFMNSEAVASLDRGIRQIGERSLLRSVLGEADIPEGEVWNSDGMFWIGYTYRYWFFMTGQTSREIARIADGGMMIGLYPRLHMDNCVAAVDAILSGRIVPRKDGKKGQS